MNNIPPKLRAEIALDPFYQRCCITGAWSRNTKIDWHHNLLFAGKQVQAKFAILPLAREVHDNIVLHKEKCDWIMLNRATDEQLKKYSRAADLFAKRDRLNKKYGIPKGK
jgi:hypothetical protein